MESHMDKIQIFVYVYIYINKKSPIFMWCFKFYIPFTQITTSILIGIVATLQKPYTHKLHQQSIASPIN